MAVKLRFARPKTRSTVMAADVAGYSRLVAVNEVETIRRLVEYKIIFERVVLRLGGRIFNTAGDAIMTEFNSPALAVRAAIILQQEIARKNFIYDESRRVTFRIGINYGPVIPSGGDLLGDTVNIASRLEGVAEPGGICVSQTVFETVSQQLRIRFNDMGLQTVKNIPEPVATFSVLFTESTKVIDLNKGEAIKFSFIYNFRMLFVNPLNVVSKFVYLSLLGVGFIVTAVCLYLIFSIRYNYEPSPDARLIRMEEENRQEIHDVAVYADTHRVNPAFLSESAPQSGMDPTVPRTEKPNDRAFDPVKAVNAAIAVGAMAAGVVSFAAAMSHNTDGNHLHRKHSVPKSH